MSNFQNPKVPPTGGSHLPHAHPSVWRHQRPAYRMAITFSHTTGWSRRTFAMAFSPCLRKSRNSPNKAQKKGPSAPAAERGQHLLVLCNRAGGGQGIVESGVSTAA
jgi:hypothetical protein